MLRTLQHYHSIVYKRLATSHHTSKAAATRHKSYMTVAMETRILPVDAAKIGKVSAVPVAEDVLDELQIELDLSSVDARYLQEAAEKLRSSEVPVAFPTETVYGLGADATRSAAVKGIYKAKQRPSDNPLIVHFASLRQLRSLLTSGKESQQNGSLTNGTTHDPIPDIYRSLISRFWPGPLTIILPNPDNSPLAPEVTAGLKTFGARMPSHILAAALIQLAGVPVAAPSANASTKPSPTAAEHVAYDLDGRIETILDGGPCDVGVESTVVDGLSTPPLILRPGGISLEQIRSCPGWEATEIGYKNIAEIGSQPRAPGMKYRHYSPKATVILFESGKDTPAPEDLRQHLGSNAKIGIVQTRSWIVDTSDAKIIQRKPDAKSPSNGHANGVHYTPGFAGVLKSLQNTRKTRSAIQKHDYPAVDGKAQILCIDLGSDTADIARGIFSALRDLDRENVDAIFVEGIDDSEGDTAAAIMNRLRKAAEVRVEG
ncbi:Threonylcarbamoyl-AMP synthase [Fulvia fulva]|uniref:Threonylcarbamoyl-AMP synthase n=1 Tax=Passalora fulva TaxID=5499 RepID=A0A9Q8UT80_PASFU|nr:Threonylcarbamoyl-AMP synthase [Fulvia fulva]KAK4613905.1 Threonylcarbamoyl-AMP synthase [Fulvia fulva]KAK4614598.1 Threonylcarbamoyl-AMP synthase [Fulvia fulva]UJO21537.1 Threonylcarbamoyl-AMP synthase [Fulvia fulva]WPV20117.1 Threonylcarbamoyl-AMP synthase [Fulvia fulva]WPV35585.1 Threonylcarbamoyl-AMP synthase [Fulvia fulva]